MNWVLTIVGIAALILIHEGGHAVAARMMGMRVDRFALFFPPLLLRRRIGETEFAIGAIPLGGYVKILGQGDPDSVPPQDIERSYSSKAVWRRAVVIFAGPLANIVACLVILTAILTLQEVERTTTTVARGEIIAPAKGSILPGDRIISVDSISGSAARLTRQTRTHRCQGRPAPGCVASTPAVVVLERGGKTVRLRIPPRYDGRVGAMRLGFSFGSTYERLGLFEAVGRSVEASWSVVGSTLGGLAAVADPEKRSQVSGIVVGATVTAQVFSESTVRALELLAFISLSIAVVNLIPLLPLDGGHLFWLLVEAVRGRPAPRRWIEGAGLVGFALFIALTFLVLSGDIARLSGGGVEGLR